MLRKSVTKAKNQGFSMVLYWYLEGSLLQNVSYTGFISFSMIFDDFRGRKSTKVVNFFYAG